jgi:hypothetical protein
MTWRDWGLNFQGEFLEPQRDIRFIDDFDGWLGNDRPWRVHSDSQWVVIRASRPWVFRRPDPEERDRNLYTDGDHILLFPQDREGMCPRTWLAAAWPFLEHFRSNFTFYPPAAYIYNYVTLIGPPSGDRFGIAPALEDLFRQAPWRRVERLATRKAAELKDILQQRIDKGERFSGSETENMSPRDSEQSRSSRR